MSTIEMIPPSPQQPLLGEYVFLSIEEETEEMVVEKYSQSNMEYTLKIEKKEGKKHGPAKLVDMDNHVVAELTFDQGNLTGPFTVFNSERKVSFKGMLKNGVKHGFGREYDDNGAIICEGIYEDGSLKIFHRERSFGRLNGYIEERTPENKVLSISQMKTGTPTKEGWSIDFSAEDEIPMSKRYYEDGKLKWEKIHVDKTRMIERNEEGQIVYEGEFKYSDGYFYRWGEGNEYEDSGVLKYHGTFEVDVYHGKGTFFRNNKKYFEGNWEYDSPEGEGTLFKGENGEEVKGEWNLGYLDGIDYWTGGRRGICSTMGDSRKMERMEREKVSKMILKKEEDEKKKRQYRQRKEQIKNIIVNALINPSQTFDLEELKIDDNLSSRDYGDSLKFILKGSQFPSLKRTIIGKNCFRFIKRFEIDMLPVLEEVEIGNNSFFLREDLNIDSSCSITNCLNLKTIIFGRGCFYYYRKVKISRCSIQSLDISKYCMWYSDLILQGMN